MANLMENQVGMVKETVYNTPVTVTRFYPYISGTAGQFDTRQRQGQGVFVGTKRAWRGDRRVMPIGQGVVTIKCELASRQGGMLLEAATGVAAWTINGAGPSGVIVAKTSVTGTVLPSYTIQLGAVNNAGTVDVETFAGCTAVSAEIECPEDGILTISVTFDAWSFTTVTALATASYTAAAFLFDQSQGAAGVGGTLTVPTTIVLGTGTTAFGNFRSWKLTWSQTTDIGRWVLGGRNQPTVSAVVATFGGSAEYNDTTLRTAYLAGTSLPVTVTHTTAEVLVPAGFSQFQVAIPQLFLKSPILPEITADTSVVAVEGECTFDNTNELVLPGLQDS